MKQEVHDFAKAWMEHQKSHSSSGSQVHKKKAKGGPIIGIDLGLTYATVAFMEQDQPQIIENSEGMRTTPTTVAFTDEGLLVGIAARRQVTRIGCLIPYQMANNALGTIYGAKRLLGRQFDDPIVQTLIKKVPFHIVPGPNGEALIDVKGKTHSPSEIASCIHSIFSPLLIVSRCTEETS